jgi:3-dehydroquinate dehydratase / shikimate dehydrogenase
MKRYPICLSLFGTTEELIALIQASRDADLFEIRLDLSPILQIEELRSATRKPLLFTAHGRPDLLQQAKPFADYLDVEQSVPPDVSYIASMHVKEGEPRELWLNFSKSHLAKMVFDTADYRKIAELLDLDHSHHPRALCFAMGEIGAFSRILSVFRGAPWIYACLPGRSTAPGQFTMDELVQIYRIPRFQEVPRVFGIVGDPVSHSRSPQYHNHRFAQDSLSWIYLPFPCTDLSALFQYAPQFGVSGFSITHPHKERALSLLQHRSVEVEQLRSCNTVCYKNGEWYGVNTDIEGIANMLKKNDVAVSGSRALIIGAGGAARAIASVIRPDVRELTILNRTIEKANAFASLYDARSGTLKDFGKFSYDLLFQATPVGFIEGQCPVNPSLLQKGATVIDANYYPRETLLLKKAKALGCKTINGEDWFEAQAEAQFRWWFRMLNAPSAKK